MLNTSFFSGLQGPHNVVVFHSSPPWSCLFVYFLFSSYFFFLFRLPQRENQWIFSLGISYIRIKESVNLWICVYHPFISAIVFSFQCIICHLLFPMTKINRKPNICRKLDGFFVCLFGWGAMGVFSCLHQFSRCVEIFALSFFLCKLRPPFVIFFLHCCCCWYHFETRNMLSTTYWSKLFIFESDKYSIRIKKIEIIFIYGLTEINESL